MFFCRGLHCPVCSEFLKLLDAQLEDYKKSKTKWLLFQWIIRKKAIKAKENWDLKNINIAYGLSIENAREWDLYISNSIKEAESDIFCEPAFFLLSKKMGLCIL